MVKLSLIYNVQYKIILIIVEKKNKKQKTSQKKCLMETFPRIRLITACVKVSRVAEPASVAVMVPSSALGPLTVVL